MSKNKYRSNAPISPKSASQESPGAEFPVRVGQDPTPEPLVAEKPEAAKPEDEKPEAAKPEDHATIHYDPSAELRRHEASITKGVSMKFRGVAPQIQTLLVRLEIVERRFEGLMDVLVNNEIVSTSEVREAACQTLHEAVTELEADLSATLHAKVVL